jgi:serine protease Do
MICVETPVQTEFFMIRRTLAVTKLATYSVDLPDATSNGLPCATGTGFFVSAEGWFVTAAHVVTQNGRSDGPVRGDIEQAWLMKETRPGQFNGGMCQGVKFDYIDPSTDFALLKVDFAQNSDKHHLAGQAGFPLIEVSCRELDEGEPVYAFGYPLSPSHLLVSNANMTAGFTAHCPRTTSAVVASTMDMTKLVHSPSEPKVYVLDKAPNYGNSGGPIVSIETGKVHAFCSRFQPVEVPQPHLKDNQGNPIVVWIPSLYGVVSSPANPGIFEQLRIRNIPVSAV